MTPAWESFEHGKCQLHEFPVSYINNKMILQKCEGQCVAPLGEQDLRERNRKNSLNENIIRRPEMLLLYVILN